MKKTVAENLRKKYFYAVGRKPLSASADVRTACPRAVRLRINADRIAASSSISRTRLTLEP